MYGAKERWEVDTILRIMGCVMFVKTHVDLWRASREKAQIKMPAGWQAFLFVSLCFGFCLVFCFDLCLFLGQQDVQQDRHHGSRNDAGAAEDQLNSFGSEVQDTGVGAHAIADAQSNGHDGQIAAGQRLLGNQLDTADHDGGEHHNGSATQNSLGHDGDQRTQLGAQATQD